MKRLILLLLVLLPIYAGASHIVGGEFEMLRLPNGQFRINMVLYFDVVNGAQGAKDDTVHVYFYRKADRFRVKELILSLNSEKLVNYTQNQCADGSLVTNKIIYTAVTDLPARDFSDPAGYFMEYQRCCRNYSITNIYSEIPPPQGSGRRYAGQTFYLEFPPVMRNGKEFINSSPHLFPPLSDYACINRRYYVDFAGVDDDGDSLAYSLVTPLNTRSNQAYPGASPGPFPDVQWRPGFDLQHITGGKPDLRITPEGFITVTPTQTGLFVFAVKCEEFRDGIKIGETRRDFQMLVQDCQISVPPFITGKQLSEPTFSAHGVMSVSFANTVTDQNRCINVRVADEDSKDPLQNFQETIRIRAVALNFRNKDLNKMLPDISIARLTNGSTADFTICFDKCPLVPAGPMEIGIIAFDDACALPLSDTLKVTVNIQPPPNQPPTFIPTHTISETLQEGDARTWNLQAVDPDGDSVMVSAATDGFLLADAGMIFQASETTKGIADVSLHWDAYCHLYNFNHRTTFQVKVFVEDKDQCDQRNLDEATFNLAVQLPFFPDPHLDTDLTADPDETIVPVSRSVFEHLDFNVTGDITNQDTLRLSMITDLPLDKVGATFTGKKAVHQVSSPFSWSIACAGLDLAKKDSFQIQFIVLDSTNKCRLLKADTVMVKLKVLPPLNLAPKLSLVNLNTTGTTLTNNTMAVLPGTPIQLNLTGTDTDVAPIDHLVLKLDSVGGTVPPEGYTFQDAQGETEVTSPFTWQPDCSLFRGDVFANEYRFYFSVKDNRCITGAADTVSLRINLADVPHTNGPVQVPNIITPNGDGCNDYFAVSGIEAGSCYSGSVTPDESVGLPEDNCLDRFEKVVIVNRWGQTVFTSTDRHFRWYAQHEAAGVFFYDIRFTHQRFKGSLTVAY
ncbi:MAG: gliding motility-associated C-terminal domain-containing protein [Cyclobacteriaceae bacterium]